MNSSFGSKYCSGYKNLRSKMCCCNYLSNCEISPCYQAIRDCDKGIVPFGDPTERLFEPILAWISNLMAAFAREEEIE